MTTTNEAQLANSLETLLRVGFDYDTIRAKMRPIMEKARVHVGQLAKRYKRYKKEKK